jgi:addiction module HigA family antidote
MAREYLVKRDPKMPPVHPGELLREEAFPAMGISVAAAARGMHISRQMLHGILAEKRGITPEMALRLGKLIGNGPGLWLRMQQNYDMWQAQELLTEELVQIPTVTRTRGPDMKAHYDFSTGKRGAVLRQPAPSSVTTASSGRARSGSTKRR